MATFIDIQTVEAPFQALGMIEFASEANPTNVHNYQATAEIEFYSIANPSVDRPGEAVGEIEFYSYALGSIDGSPTIYGTAESEIEFESEATPQRVIYGYAQGDIEFDADADSHITVPDTYTLNFIFDTVESIPAGANAFGAIEGQIHDQGRVTFGAVDTDPATWTELAIANWKLEEPENSASSTVEFLLADPKDLEHFGPGTRFEFSISQKILGVWDESTKKILIPNGEYRGSRKVVSWDNGAPGDNVRIIVSSGLDVKLVQTAQKDLIIFDPSRDDVDEATLEPLMDTLGNAYYPEVVRVNGLSLHQLFQEIFVERCGFDAFATNIPDYGIKRYECAMGASLYDALKGSIGMFDPVIYADVNTIWIVDTSVTVPAGFPAARTWDVSQYKVYADQIEREQLDALLVQYIAETSDYDFTTRRTDPDEVTVSGNTETTTERQFLEYRKFTMPYVVLREALDKETRTTRVNGTIVSVQVDDLTYQLGLVTKRVKTVQDRLPDIALSSSSNTVYAMQQTEKETETYTYRKHPFKARQKYLATKLTSRTGLILNDPTNLQFSEQFESLYRVAWRSGNVYEGMTLRTGNIWSREEKSKPLRNGQVRTHVSETDELKNLVIHEYTEERTGDVGIGSSEGQQRILVFEQEFSTPVRNAKDRIESIHIGEVPIIIGIPLARRKLKARRLNGVSSLSVESVGFDRGLKRGSTALLTGRKFIGLPDPETLMNGIILSRTLEGKGTDISASYVLRKV